MSRNKRCASPTYATHHNNTNIKEWVARWVLAVPEYYREIVSQTAANDDSGTTSEN